MTAKRSTTAPSAAATTMAAAMAALLLVRSSPVAASAFVAPAPVPAAGAEQPPPARARSRLRMLPSPLGAYAEPPSRRGPPAALSSRGLLPLEPPATNAAAGGGSGSFFARPPTSSRPRPAGTDAARSRSTRRDGGDGDGTILFRSSNSLQRRVSLQSTTMTSSAESQRGLPSPSQQQQGGSRWLERLSSLSNVASLLCVVDCTLLPVATIVLPLLGIAAGPAGAELFHAIGHAVAIFFVMPVGCLAAATNYLTHRRLNLTLPALAGLTLVYLANASHTGLFLSHLPHDFLHSLSCGTILHRATNIAGCALLLTSNLLSRKWQEANDVACLGGRLCGRPECRIEEKEGGELFFTWDQPS